MGKTCILSLICFQPGGGERSPKGERWTKGCRLTSVQAGAEDRRKVMCMGHTAGGEEGWTVGRDCGVGEGCAWAERPEGEGRFAWVEDGGCVPGITERASDWGGGEDPGAKTSDSGPGYSRETLARGPSPFPIPWC